MKSYVFVLFSILIGIACTDKSGKSTELSSNQASPKHPNIIILFCDDLGYGDLGITGHPNIKTPNLDHMAGEGMRLTNFYSGSPACTASRYALLTGRYPIRSGFDWVLYPASERGIHPEEVTLAEALKNVGYATAGYGKWHLGTTKKEYLPLQNGFDEYLGLPYSNDMRPPKWPDIALLKGNDTLELNPDQRKLTELYTREAMDFMQRKQNEPFFVYLPYAMPHVPLFPGENFEGKSKRGIYGDVVEEIDWSVGQILAHLKNLKLDKNTLVFFTSDNGPWIIRGLNGGSSGLFKDGKGSTWEGGMRVPAIAWGPGMVPAGTTNTQTASVIDLYRTMITLAGGTVQESAKVDGLEFTDVLLGNAIPMADRTLFYYGLSNKLMAVRKGKWKLHTETYSQTGKDYFEGKLPLLFNLDTDPSEEHDVSDQQPELVAELIDLIRQQQEKMEVEGTYFDEN
ncbi:MAG: arylsulfatase [Saprospiraceae bacterium]|nr:MAG: arylsulfatase [Saprospiraceae bacterium]